MNYEFRKGLLFVRLEGVLNEATSRELSVQLDHFINRHGVKYFVMNLENLDYLDKDGLDFIHKKYEDVVMHNGKLIICGYDNEYLKPMIEEIKEVYKTKDELTAFNIIRI